jgi:hypothetical protein
MSLLRFATVQDLYESFPTAADDIKLPASNEPSLAFVQNLIAKHSWFPAISFCAYLLPRREAIWWGCQSIRRMQLHLNAKETEALDIAEAWVREPDDPHRRAALELGVKSDGALCSTWMLLAVGWSGGNLIAPSQHAMAVQPAPQQTARAVRGGVMLALARLTREQINAAAKSCLEEAIALATAEPHS